MNQITLEAIDKTYSDVLHETIRENIEATFKMSLGSGSVQHYREILDDIIADLQQYAATLPTVEQMEEEGLL